MIANNSRLKERAQELRKNATAEENTLWYRFLKAYPVQFHRQATIDRFIVDFYCPKAYLVIELDGMHHFTEDGKAYDRERTEKLNMLGIDVLRFSDWEVQKNFRKVCERIDFVVKKRIGQMQSTG